MNVYFNLPPPPFFPLSLPPPYPRGTTDFFYIKAYKPRHVAWGTLQNSIDTVCPHYEYSYDNQDPFYLIRLSHKECIHMASPQYESLHDGQDYYFQ